MVDPRHRKAPVLEAPPEVGAGARWKLAVFGGAALVIGVVAWFVWHSVQEGNDVGRWRELARIEGPPRDEVFAADRSWLDVPASKETVASRDEAIEKLEGFLAKEGSDPVLAAQVHALIAELEEAQILGVPRGASFEALKARYDRADQHLAAIEEKYPDAPLNWERLKPAGEATTAKLLRKVLKANRAWDEQHALKPVEPDADLVVVLRTTKGDLRIRVYSADSPTLAKGFVERACAGDYDGTSFFTKRDEPDEGWVRGGNLATRPKGDKDPTDDDRLSWGDSTPGVPLLPEEGRNRILHSKGTLSAWHDSRDEDDDPVQFIIEVADSPRFDYRFTPFAKLDAVSLPALERIFAAPTRRTLKPEAPTDPKYAKIADQFVKPVVIKKALVYEKSALKVCGNASRADDSEKRLDTLKPDAYLVEEPPPAPPTPPTPATPATPGSPPTPAPMNDEPMGK